MRSWSEIQGQERAKGLLESAVERDRLHHGYLFVGPTGVGKLSTALALARVLNCSRRAEERFQPACGSCPSCRKFSNNLQHPDLHLVRPEGGVNKTIKIAQVRAIQKVASTRPYEGRYQLVILDDAHAMTDEAANALLKTLEEPPESMKLFLVTDQPRALIDTIRSRCQTLRFGALDRRLVADILRRELDSPPVAELLEVAAKYGEGSVGRAHDFIEAGMLEERVALLDTMEVLSRERTATLLERAEKLAKDRSNLPGRLELIGVLLRDALLWQVGIPPEKMVNADLLDRVAALGRRLDSDALLARIEAVRVARALLRRNVNGALIVENLFTELAPGPLRVPVKLPKV